MLAFFTLTFTYFFNVSFRYSVTLKCLRFTCWYVFEFLYLHIGFPRWCSGKKSACQCKRPRRCRFNPWVGKISWSRKWQPTPVFLPGESYGQKSLVGYRLGSQRVRRNWSDLPCTHLSRGEPWVLYHIDFRSTRMDFLLTYWDAAFPMDLYNKPADN